MAGYRFLCDEHIGVPVSRALEEAGCDITHILTLGLGGTGDPKVFQYARNEGRILLTRNYRDFAPLVEKQGRAKECFPGVLFVAISPADVDAHVRALQEWIKEAEQGGKQIENTYGWLR